MADQYGLFIDGKWINTSDTVTNRNPSDVNDVIGEYAQANAGQVDMALEAASRSVAEWGVSPMESR